MLRYAPRFSWKKFVKKIGKNFFTKKKIQKKIQKIFREIFFSNFFWLSWYLQPIWCMPAKIWGVYARWFGRR
jgi:hypothetical protein